MATTRRDFVFEYPTPNYARQHARCRVRVWERPEHTVVIATELPSGSGPDQNPGASVTSTVESIATELCRQGYVRQPDALLLVEHYDDRGTPAEKFRSFGSERGESFDLVRFRRKGDTFSNPDWKHVRKAEVERLIGESPT